MLVLQVLTIFLTAVAMALAVAHALELPGKMRLDKETYMAVQTIYYPGFTLGASSEGLAIIAALILLLLTPRNRGAFWWTLAGLIALVAMHVVYWTITHATNKLWMKNQKVSKAGAKFFSSDPMRQGGAVEEDVDDWKRFRDKWEYSHVARAILDVIALVALTVAVAA